MYEKSFGKNLKADTAELKDQLLRFTKYPVAAKTPAGVNRFYLSGKGPSGNMNDDLAMALMINIAMFNVIKSEKGRVKYNTAQLPAIEINHEV